MVVLEACIILVVILVGVHVIVVVVVAVISSVAVTEFPGIFIIRVEGSFFKVDVIVVLPVL